MLYAYCSLYISIFLGAAAQLLLKWGAVHHERIGSLFLEPYLMMGLACYFVAALLYIFALKTIPLSLAFPSVSLSYVLVAYAAHRFFHERIGLSKILAMVLILTGVIVLSRS